MTTNEEILVATLKEDYEVIKKCWSPYAIIYNPLKVGSIDGTDTIPHDRAISRAQDAHYKPNKKVKGKPECTLFISRLSESTTETTLRKIFSEFGAVKRLRLVEDIVTGRSKCYAFVEYESDVSALNAYKRAFGLFIDGKQILVDMECERLLPGWVPRRLGGGFCGKKESGQLRFGCRYKQFKKPIQLMTDKDKQAVESSLRSKLSDSTQDDGRCFSRTDRMSDRAGNDDNLGDRRTDGDQVESRNNKRSNHTNRNRNEINTSDIKYSKRNVGDTRKRSDGSRNERNRDDRSHSTSKRNCRERNRSDSVHSERYISGAAQTESRSDRDHYERNRKDTRHYDRSGSDRRQHSRDRKTPR